MIAQRLQEALDLKGRSAYWLAEQMADTDVRGRSYPAIKRYLAANEPATPNERFVDKAAQILQVPPAWLLGAPGDPRAAMTVPVDRSLYDVGRGLNEGPADEDAFQARLKRELPEYAAWTPLVRVMFHNAHRRRLYRLSEQARDVGAVDRAKAAVDLGQRLLADWREIGRETGDDWTSPAWTDYAVARLHAMMLAMAPGV